MARTLKQRQQSRINGEHGGAPTKELVRRLTRVRDRARLRGASALRASVDYLIHVLHSSSESTDDRIRAAENLCDRFGLPRMQSVHQVDESTVAPKLYLEASFEPPPSFNPDPPTDRVLSVGDLALDDRIQKMIAETPLPDPDEPE